MRHGRAKSALHAKRMPKADRYMNVESCSEVGGKAARDVNATIVVDDDGLVVIIGGVSVGDGGNDYGMVGLWSMVMVVGK